MTNEMTYEEFVPKEKRWLAAVTVVREIVSYRQSEPLSKEVMDTDPSGSLVLTTDFFNNIKLGMTLEEVTEANGCPPHTGDNETRFSWTTMSGSYVRFMLDRKKGNLICKTYSNTILKGLRAKKSFDVSNKPVTPKSESWPAISTEAVVKYFIAHSNTEQLRWLQKALSGSTRFEECEHYGGDKGIAFKFDVEDPDFFEDCDFEEEPARNALTKEQVDQLWNLMMKLGSREALSVRNRLMDAVNMCVNFASDEDRGRLLRAVQKGDFLRAERIKEHVLHQHRQARLNEAKAVVEKREEAGDISGRDYKKEEEGDLWRYYKTLIYMRDDYRCQYCGVPNNEHKNPFYHIDHIFPVSRGGKTKLSNLQLLCGPCNSAKATKLESEFPAEQQANWFKNRKS